MSLTGKLPGTGSISGKLPGSGSIRGRLPKIGKLIGMIPAIDTGPKTRVGSAIVGESAVNAKRAAG